MWLYRSGYFFYDYLIFFFVINNVYNKYNCQLNENLFNISDIQIQLNYSRSKRLNNNEVDYNNDNKFKNFNFFSIT